MNSTSYDDPKRLWFDLLKWRKQRLPMGCGTDKSAEGLVGMHAYSILDISEITNVGVDFFKDRLIRGTLGNVSGFTEYDGKVRLLRIRNPHGQVRLFFACVVKKKKQILLQPMTGRYSTNPILLLFCVVVIIYTLINRENGKVNSRISVQCGNSC
jgi:hypothetical protein